MRSIYLLATVSLLSIVGCVASNEAASEAELTGDVSQAACADVSGTNIRRSLVVTDPAILAKFSFKRTIDQVRTTANVKADETSAGVFQRWMRTFDTSTNGGGCNDARIDPNKYGLTCPRQPEAKLAKVNPFGQTATVKFQPVGLFNRFDLAPNSGAHCGEYRIVYAMSSSDPNIGGRGFIIFEGILPNPNPAGGVAACLPVAQFWQGLTSDANVDSRAAKLEKFYFTGGAVAGFSPVVQAANYGLVTNAGTHGAGQIRTNFFVDFFEWHLREFKLHRSCTTASDPQTCTLAFKHVTVKTNPAEELFAGTHTNSTAFQNAFLDQVPALAATNLNKIKMSIGNQFNEFESVSSDIKVVYRDSATADLKSRIQTKLTSIGSDLKPNQILNRATTQTCAGCHQASNGQALGGGLTWPSTLNFVHIDETSALSSALTGTFLPHRKSVLEKFINDRCTGAPVSADGFTIGGSPTDAPN